ncbi:MAG: murein L,D-transpeptidase family protein [Desulfopila sp.]
MKYLLLAVILLFSPGPVAAKQTVDYVLVKKGERQMFLIKDGKIIRNYKISLGKNPEGAKEREGDKRTPEGLYLLDYKLEESMYYKAIHISYPNAKDLENARRKNLDPGGKIMIHGQLNGLGDRAAITQQYDWTSGCIAVTNEEMDQIWQLVEDYTPIRIEK